ncbi:hypothetical protein EMQ25_15035 [Arsenicitalea aurantiaca]|uniref:Acyloxyacyl hydrolase n=1 Tax=Arsenicitalea aurantiaca TaxID=1783274 RepID=A0A433X5W3_9HYPH|nr:hypothetical protein [Arsenicitalea aurantiaca]RUT29427.1 hypothetical protein EMQ25_15035 [Arsenicitalea aurantiaca]
MARSRLSCGIAALGLSAALAVPAVALDAPQSPTAYDQAVFFFAGRMHDGFFGESFNPVGVDYEDNFVLGAGYQQFHGTWHGIALGVEAGLAARFGEAGSVEAWGGGVARFDMVDLGPVRVSPALTFGLSLASGTIGIETERSDAIGGAPPVLFYLAPELNFSLIEQPQTEIFWRVQHRSGGFGTIAHIDGSNANVLGLRHRF